MLRNDYPRGYREDEELYVYDQCCENCRFYCESDDNDDFDEASGCKNYGREDYERRPPSHWCCDWKGRGKGGRR